MIQWLPAGAAYNPTHLAAMTGEVKEIEVDAKGERVLVTEVAGRFKVFTHPQGELQYEMGSPLNAVLASGFAAAR